MSSREEPVTGEKAPHPRVVPIRLTHDKAVYQCFCGTRVTIPRSEWSEDIQSCSCQGFKIPFPRQNHTGKRFGRLVITGWAGKPSETTPNHQWHCRCDCGTTKAIGFCALLSGSTKSCGCLSREKTKARNTARKGLSGLDLTTLRFGQLVALQRGERPLGSRNLSAWWDCRCDCGSLVTKPANNLTAGITQDCGNRERHPLSLDIAGVRFNGLIAIRNTGIVGGGNSLIWECLCECGQQTTATVNSLRSGNKASCGGCNRRRAPIEPGTTFGLLTALQKEPFPGRATWLCECSCGTQVSVPATRLFENGASYSCGCKTQLRFERVTLTTPAVLVA